MTLERFPFERLSPRSDPSFVRLFSGDVAAFTDTLTRVTWATPYALSIYGEDMYQNCPFGTGDGYGDGRAISIGEIVTSLGVRWELQLKGIEFIFCACVRVCVCMCVYVCVCDKESEHKYDDV